MDALEFHSPYRQSSVEISDEPDIAEFVDALKSFVGSWGTRVEFRLAPDDEIATITDMQLHRSDEQFGDDLLIITLTGTGEHA